jgi:tetratricopeptide (TPR) repeat protein
VIEWASAAVVLVLAAGVAASWWQARRATAEAVRADAARDDADHRRQEAEEAYGLARDSLVRIGADLPDALRQAIYTREARARATQVLADALSRQLDPTAVRGLSGRSQMALHIQAGDVLAELGKRKEAETHYKAALEISKELLQAGGPDAALAQGNHALVLSKLAVAERDAQHTSESAARALEPLAEVEAMQRELLAHPPPDRTPAELRKSVAQTLLERATTFRMLQQYDRALGPCQEAIDLLRPRADDGPANRHTRDCKAALAGALGQLGSIQTARQDDRAAERALSEAAALSAEVLAGDPRNPLHRMAAARAAREAGDFLLMRDRPDEAGRFYAQVLAAFRDLLATAELLALRFELGDAYYRSATLALKRHDATTAAAEYSHCRALWQEVTDANPTNRNRLALCLAQARLGQHQAAADFARRLLAERAYSVFEGLQSVCVLALCGEAANGEDRRRYLDESLAGLTRLVKQLGFRNVAQLKTDPDLDPLRGEPAFEAIIKELDAGGN